MTDNAAGTARTGRVERTTKESSVLVELDLHRPAGAQHRDAGAAVVEQQVLELAEVARQDRPVDVFAVQVAVGAAGLLVAGL